MHRIDIMNAVNSADESTATNDGSVLIEESGQSPITRLVEGEERPLLSRNEQDTSNSDSPAASCTNCGYHHPSPKPAGESMPHSSKNQQQTDTAAAASVRIAPPLYHPPYHHNTVIAPTPPHTLYHPSSYRYPDQPPQLPPPPYPFQQHGISHYSTSEATGSVDEPSKRTNSALSTGAPLLVSAVAFGSILGIAAAAAVRWLNGDDFVLFPPSNTTTAVTDATTTTTTTPSTDLGNAVEASIPAGDITNDSLQIYHVQQQSHEPHEQTAVLREIVRTRSDKQTALLLRLEELVSKQQKMEEYIEVTNQSIDDLRQQQQLNENATAATSQPPLDNTDVDSAREMATWLHGIRNELSLIRESLTPMDRGHLSSHVDDSLVLQSKLVTVLAKLDATLDGATTGEVEERIVESLFSHNDMFPPTVSSTDDTPESKAALLETVDLTLAQQPVRANQLLKAFSKTIQLNGGGRIASSATSSTPLGCSSALRDAICELVMANTKEKLVSGAQLLYLYVVNVANHPRVPRYRKIFCNNESYQHHVATLLGARELLLAVGFVEKEPMRPSPQRPYATSSLSANSIKQASHWEWLPSPVSPPDDALATTDPISPSCATQKPWFDDAEAALVERLKEATAALAVLKVASFSDKDDLIYAALSSAGLLVEGPNTPCTDQTAPSVTFIAQIDAVKSSDEIVLDSVHTLDETVTPHRKNGESSESEATPQDSSNVVLPMIGCNDATTPDRTIGSNGSTTRYDCPPSIVSINSSLLETPPFSGSIISPPATKSVMTLNKDFTLQPMSPVESKAIESAPTQLLQFATTELLEELDQGESGASSVSDDAEAVMWK